VFSGKKYMKYSPHNLLIIIINRTNTTENTVFFAKKFAESLQG
jgi:hypothetical protein